MRITLAVVLALVLLVPAVVAKTPPVAPVNTQPPADLAAPPEGAEKTASGLVTKTLVAGKGDEHPGPGDVVKVRYTVWSSDGTIIDHVDSPRVAMLPVAKMIAGWREGVQLMSTGESRRMWIPESLGAAHHVPAGGHMLIDTELVEIVHTPTPPADVAAIPADASKLPSGLAYKVLRPGTGTKHPRSTTTVRVHYSGWTTDGQMFDSSVLRGEPAQFSLEGVIPGWREGLQLMVEGEKTRFWIPANLAYAHKPGKPQGMLVFDVELLAIE